MSYDSKDIFSKKHSERMTLKQFLTFLRTNVSVTAQKVELEETNQHVITAFPRRDVLTIKELSDTLGVTPRHIHRLIKGKALPVWRVIFAVKRARLIKNQLVFSYDEIKEWIMKPFLGKKGQPKSKK